MLNSKIARAKQILKDEGLTSLLRRGFIFIARFLFQYKSYYLYEHKLTERNESDFLPRIKNYTFKIISSNQQVSELVADGFNLYPDVTKFTKSLDKGAIAFCIFIERELAHIGLVATSEEAKNTFDLVTYKVAFSNKEACTGGTWTNPKYRGSGLMAYGYFKRFQYLMDNGWLLSRNAVNASNVISQKVHAKFNPKITKARYLKILWWQSWKENR